MPGPESTTRLCQCKRELRENQDTTPHEAGSDPRRESDWPTIRASWLYRAGMCSLGAASLTAEAGGRGSGKRSYAFLALTKKQIGDRRREWNSKHTKRPDAFGRS